MLSDRIYMPEVAKPEPRRPTKEFAEAAISLAKEKWKTNAEILRAMGYGAEAKNNTLRLLRDGKGSDKSGRALRDALKRVGVDTAKLPPMYEGESEDAEGWREEWIRIGELLHEHSPPMYQRFVEEMRPLAKALASATRQLIEISRAT